jgi:hypothetical protein
MHDPQGRRGLWVATDCESVPDDDVSCDALGLLQIHEISLFAGREGNDEEVTLRQGQVLDHRTFTKLLAVIGAARAAYREGERADSDAIGDGSHGIGPRSPIGGVKP